MQLCVVFYHWAYLTDQLKKDKIEIENKWGQMVHY